MNTRKHTAQPARRHTRFARMLVAALTLVAAVVATASAAHATRPNPNHSSFSTTIQRVVAMPRDQDLQRRARDRGLNVLNVLWEDTARSAGSVYGPNISDVTLQVLEDTPQGRRAHLLPVLRFPNFTDRTADIPMEDFYIRVGNHRDGGELRTVSLREVLRDLSPFLSESPQSARRRTPLNLLAARDTHVLVSAQHVFLPIPREGQATFTPAIFNYQSSPGNPAVLTLLVTRQGMSATVIENRRGEQTSNGRGQQLFFNQGGDRAPFTAERRSTVQRRVESGRATEQDAGALDPGADVLLFIQVPLRYRQPPARGGYGAGAIGSGAPVPPPASAPSGAARMRAESSDVEVAVLGHGEVEGPFIELNGQQVVRDDRFPVRVTVQFYRATSNGVVSDADLDEVRAQIERVYEQADYVGSLVVPDGPRNRPTDWIRTHPEAEADSWRPFGWWLRPN